MQREEVPNEVEEWGGALLLPQEYERWEVHKFGGASLADAALYQTCGNLLIEAARTSNGKKVSIPTMAVVSAAFGMTDELIKIVRTAEQGDLEGAVKLLGVTCDKVLSIAKGCGVSEGSLEQISKNLEQDKSDLSAVLCAIRIMKSVPDTAMELVTGMGEVWSAQTMCAYLQKKGFPAVWMDCRTTLYVEDGGTHGLGEKGASNMLVRPMMGKTAEAMRKWWLDVALEKGWVEVEFVEGKEGPPNVNFVAAAEKVEPMVIVTGFVATTPSGVPTTLKRSGSDFTATIVANLCSAGKITMWKNVDGIYTADPRKVPDAFPIKSLMYEEAMELAYFGASVLHPSAMAPCIEARVPVHVRNVFNTAHPGTVIEGSVHDVRGGSTDSSENLDPKDYKRSQMFGQGSFGARIPRPSMSFGEEVAMGSFAEELDKDKLPVKGITCVENVSLVNLEDASLIGVPGVLSRMFGALAAKNISVLMITQASSEHSTCCAVADCDAHAARDAVREAFALELHNHQVSRVQVIKHLSAVAAVGEGMAMTLGVPGKMFTALASAGIAIRAIAQGSSTRNITAVVDRSQLCKAMRAIHSAFTLSAVPISVGIIGVGKVGRGVIDLIRTEHERIKKELHLDLRLRLVVDVGRTLVKPERISLENFDQEWEEAKSDKDIPLSQLHEALLGTHYPHSIVIDCTASETVAAQHKVWLQNSIHVISANRKAGSASLEQFEATLAMSEEKNTHWSYAVTAGGALPSMVCIQDMLNTGDNVRRLEGMLSSTMDHVLSAISPFNVGVDSQAGKQPIKFSEAVVAAIRGGCTEAIGLEDLLCRDIARKLTILARSVRMQVAETKTCEGEDGSFLSKEAQEVVLRLNKGFSCGSHCTQDCTKCAEIAAALAPFDEELAQRAAKARADGMCLRCVGVVDVEQDLARVDVKEISMAEDPNICMCDGNTVLLKIKSDRSLSHPLTLLGPGTGAPLIAGAVFADLLRIGQSFH